MIQSTCSLSHIILNCAPLSSRLWLLLQTHVWTEKRIAVWTKKHMFWTCRSVSNMLDIPILPELLERQGDAKNVVHVGDAQ